MVRVAEKYKNYKLVQKGVRFITTIATDGKTIACDTRVSSGLNTYPARITKIHRVGDRFVGTCGDLWQTQMYVKYLLEDKPLPSKELKDFNALILDKDGTIYHVDTTFNELELTGPFAVGSGMDFAIGAMAAGASPKEAILIAGQYDPYTSPEALVYHVRELKKKEKKVKDAKGN